MDPKVPVWPCRNSTGKRSMGQKGRVQGHKATLITPTDLHIGDSRLFLIHRTWKRSPRGTVGELASFFCESDEEYENSISKGGAAEAALIGCNPAAGGAEDKVGTTEAAGMSTDGTLSSRDNKRDLGSSIT